MIDGMNVIIGDKKYIFADLNFKTVQKIFPYIQLLNNPSSDNYMDAVLKIITAGLQRNYPEITEDFISENLQFSEIPDIMLVITNQLTKKKNPETLATQTNQSTGVESIPVL
jgi:hypothetical protein